MKNNFIKTTYFFFLLVIIGTTSCQKVIKLDLNSASPQIVIEGNISDQAGPYFVKITKTINYNEPNTFPGVQDAIVTITENSGISEVLTETSPGVYKTKSLQGLQGKSYTLNVKSEGKEYQATSAMPVLVTITNVSADSISFGSTTNKFVNLELNDPAGIKNYYRVIEIINGDTLNRINVFNDDFQDGKKIIAFVSSDGKPKLLSGNKVEIILQNIDANVYKYFTDLTEVINGGGQSVAPANPKSNISNNALGYFSAQSIDKKSIIITDK